MRSDNRSGTRPGGRRRVARGATRRVNPVVLLSFGIPLLTVGALATVHPAPTQEPDHTPGTAPLTRSVVVCPAALPGAERVEVGWADPTTKGSLRVEGGEGFVVEPGRVASSRRNPVTVMHADGAAAVGLLAARVSTEGVGTDCLPPSADTWFTGVGAGPEHSSELVLANPDQGPAVADVTVLTAGGLREVARLRGLAVEPASRSRVDLASVMPEARDVTLRVQVTRGRLAPVVVDRVQEIGSDTVARAWLPGQGAPARNHRLLGVGPGPGERTLVLANGGDDETLVRVRAVTADSEFEPAGLEPVAVPPGTTVTVELSTFLSSDNADGVLGVSVAADDPVSAMLRTRSGARMSYAVGSPTLTEPAATIVPPGQNRLVLAGAETVTDVVVLQRGVAGNTVRERSVTLRPGEAAEVRVADRARWVEVRPAGVGVQAAVVQPGDTGTVRVVRELLTERRVPHVRPALH